MMIVSSILCLNFFPFFFSRFFDEVPQRLAGSVCVCDDDEESGMKSMIRM